MSLSDDKQSLLRAQVGADFKELNTNLLTLGVALAALAERVADLEKIHTERLDMHVDRLNALEAAYKSWLLDWVTAQERIKAIEAACEFCLRQEDKPNE